MVRGYRPRTLSKRSSSVTGVSATAPTAFARLGPARDSPALVQRMHEDPSRAWMVGWTRPDSSRGNSNRPGGVPLRTRFTVSNAAHGRSAHSVACLFLIWCGLYAATAGPSNRHQYICNVVRSMPCRGTRFCGGGCAASCTRYSGRGDRSTRESRASPSVRARFSPPLSVVR